MAWPIAYIATDRWLENYAYHFEIGPSMFLLAAAIALVVALATVSIQPLRAALADPVNALRNE